jgi:sugar phosphate isomerase/epimerase
MKHNAAPVLQKDASSRCHQLRLDASRLVASACSSPTLDLETLLTRSAAMGYRKCEAFTSWAAAHLDLDRDPAAYRAQAARHGIAFTSLHLPPVSAASGPTFARAVHAARFARDLGAGVVIFKADSRATYIAAGRPFLDAIAGCGVVPVLQNHAGSPITSLADLQEVRAGIDDPRMRTLLEVGYLHLAGTRWPEAVQALAGSIALVHIKDHIGERRVPFGQGEVDLCGLFAHLQAIGYPGDIVVEMEVSKDVEENLRLQAEAVAHCRRLFTEISP